MKHCFRVWSWKKTGLVLFLILLTTKSEGFGAAAGPASDWVRVPSGALEVFWMAPKQAVSKAEPTRLSVSSFETMVRAVTVGDYKKFLRRNSMWRRGAASSLLAEPGYLSEWKARQANDIPVTSVSWYAARAYCESIGARLPTVAEWEYMAAASETVTDANREEKFLARILAWYGEPKSKGLKRVKGIYRNVYGVWDLHGLIWEWVEDFNSSFITGESREDGALNKDLFCGAGAMNSSNKENYAAFMRFAFRSSLKGSSTVWNLGFRCVR